MRLFTAIAWFFKILFKGKKAFANAPKVEGAPERPEFHVSTEPAIQLLGLFQREGRLIDFLKEEISNYPDADIGAAVRDIHRGCRKVLDERMTLRPVVEEKEGMPYAVPEDFDPSAIELQGNISGNPPYQGLVLHQGWYVEEMNLPTVPEGGDARVAAPAQVEVKE